MRLVINPQKTLELPLYKMVRELGRRVNTERGIARFNALPLEAQLSYFKTPIEDAEAILELSKRMKPGRVSEFSAMRQHERVCERTSGSYLEFHALYFFNEGKRIYLQAQFREGDLVLRPMVQVRKEVHVYKHWMLPDWGLGARRVKKDGDIDLAHWAGNEGYYCPKSPRSYPYELQTITPYLQINIPPKKVDELSLHLLKEAAA